MSCTIKLHRHSAITFSDFKWFWQSHLIDGKTQEIEEKNLQKSKMSYLKDKLYLPII